eukprot:803326-Pelagomonas_calceolata.AAC.1
MHGQPDEQSVQRRFCLQFCPAQSNHHYALPSFNVHLRAPAAAGPPLAPYYSVQLPFCNLPVNTCMLDLTGERTTVIIGKLVACTAAHRAGGMRGMRHATKA